MEILLQKITSPTDIPLKIKDLYISAFPADERRDWEDIIMRISVNDPVFSFYVLQHNSESVGFITLWRLPGALYCEHFAISREMRGKGLGAAVMEKTIGMAGDNALVLEVELPETSSEAAKRIEFYKRCGLTAMEDFPYWQPPYSRDKSEIPMMLMTSKPLPDPTTFVLILHTLVYNQ